MKDNKKIIGAVILVVLALISFFVFSGIFSNPETFKSLFQVLDEKKNIVMGMSVSSISISNAISFIPGDAGMPLANQFADLSKWLVLITIFLYLEKYLLTTAGLILFRYVLPITLIGFAINLFANQNWINIILKKILAFGLVLFLVVPTSIGLTKMIDETHEKTLEMSIEELIETDLEDMSEEEVKDETQQSSEEQMWYNKISSFFKDTVDTIKDTAEDLSQSAKNTVQKALNAFNNYVEAIAVMIITSCVVPILTFMLFMTLIKSLLNINFDMNRMIGMVNNSVGEEAKESV